MGIQIAHYDVFVIVSGVLFVCLLVALTRWIWVTEARQLADGSVVALFGGSYALTYLAHLIGYLEIPSAALALGVLLVSTSRAYLPAVLAAGVAGVLIHENYVLTFLPITLLPAFLVGAGAARPGVRVRQFALIGAVASIIAAIVLLVALRSPMTVQQVGNLQAAMGASADFHPREDFFPVLTRSGVANLLIMKQTMTNGAWWLAQASAFITFMPTAAFFLWISLKIVNSARLPFDHRIVNAVVVLSSLCPLLLQVVGWDIYRWYALAAFNSFLVMTIVCRYHGAAPLAVTTDSVVLRNSAIALIAINMATGNGLFDGYHVDTFPFVDHWRGLVQWLGTGGHWPLPAN